MIKQMVQVLDLTVRRIRLTAANGDTLDIDVSVKVPFSQRFIVAMDEAKKRGFNYVRLDDVDRVLPYGVCHGA